MVEERQDDFMIDSAYYNSYLIITGKVDIDELLDSEDLDDTFIVLAHNPDEKISNFVIKKLIDYYAIKEEFEMCHELSCKEI